jgi:hypothetical protein
MIDLFVTYKTHRGTYKAFNIFKNFYDIELECSKIRRDGFFVRDNRVFSHVSPDEILLITFTASDDTNSMSGTYKLEN